MPILRDHTSSEIVGYSTKNWKDGSFFVSGRFSDVTATAAEVKGLAGEGFPWQASIGVRPLKIMSLEDENSKATVNGKSLKGPAEIWLESEVFEVSFVPLGADSNTRVSTFSAFYEIDENETFIPSSGSGPDGDQLSNQDKEMHMFTIEQLEKEAPELLEQIRKAAREKGAADELARIKAVSEQAMAGHETLVSQLMFDGKTTGPEAAVQVLAAEKKLKNTALENLSSGAVQPVAQVTPPETDALATDPDLPVEDQAKKDWEKDAALRKEFQNLETYTAYLSAVRSGRVKIIRKKE